MCVCVQSVLWPMGKWLDSLSVSQTTWVRIPLNVLFFPFFFFFFFFLSLLAQADICAAQLATWGVGPDVHKTTDIYDGIVARYFVALPKRLT